MNSQWNIHKWYITQLSKIKDIQTLQTKPTMLSRDISHNYPFHYANDDHFFYAPGAKGWNSLGSSVTRSWLFRLNTTLYRSSAFQSTIRGCKTMKQIIKNHDTLKRRIHNQPNTEKWKAQLEPTSLSRMFSTIFSPS